jgi:peptidoglycan lytic transglycosylase B
VIKAEGTRQKLGRRWRLPGRYVRSLCLLPSALPSLPSALCLVCAFCLLPLRAPAQESLAGVPFDQWLTSLRQEALARGISQSTLEAAFEDVREPEPVIVSRDRTQPELTQSLDTYLTDRLKAKVIARARDVASAHRELLERVQGEYGVPPAIMTAIWGVESNFGQFVGVRPTVSALATLAYDSRRSDLFRNELFEALTILERGLVTPANLKGSWAGAMGQPQFMPSSYLKYAVDFDGDAKADIWTSLPDVFASMANYLKQRGWVAGERWGREVRISKAAMDRVDRHVAMRTAGCRAVRELSEPRPLTEWKKLGVTAVGGPLPSSAIEASLVRGRRRHFLVYRNYEAILEYNCSNAYAVAIGLLADKVATK